MTENPTETTSENLSDAIGSSDNSPEKKTRKPRQTSIDKQIDRIDIMLSSGLGGAQKIVAMRNPIDAFIIEQGSPDLKKSIIELCKEDKRVRDWLYDISSGSLYLNVASASLAIILPILLNHNLIPFLFTKGKKTEENGASEEQLSFT